MAFEVRLLIAMALLLLLGWIVISQMHLYFGVLWLPLAMVAARKARKEQTR